MEKKINKKNILQHIETLSKEKKWKESLDLVKRFKVIEVTMTKSRIMSECKVSQKDIEQLNFIEVSNPYYSVSAPMKLFLIAEVNHIFKRKID